MQSGCFDSERLVALPIVEDSGGSSPRNVRGFAIVYITGCYEDSVPIDSASVPLDHPETSADQCFDAGIQTFGSANDYELRGVPINVYVTQGSSGGIGSTLRNSIVTVQTVQ
jgi:hypothetical protein